jgi:hypothetical protein
MDLALLKASESAFGVCGMFYGLYHCSMLYIKVTRLNLTRRLEPVNCVNFTGRKRGVSLGSTGLLHNDGFVGLASIRFLWSV